MISKIFSKYVQKNRAIQEKSNDQLIYFKQPPIFKEFNDKCIQLQNKMVMPDDFIEFSKLCDEFSDARYIKFYGISKVVDDLIGFYNNYDLDLKDNVCYATIGDNNGLAESSIYLIHPEYFYDNQPKFILYDYEPSMQDITLTEHIKEEYISLFKNSNFKRIFTDEADENYMVSYGPCNLTGLIDSLYNTLNSVL